MKSFKDYERGVQRKKKELIQLAYLCHTWPVAPSDLKGLQVNLKTGELWPGKYFGRGFGCLTLTQLPTVLGLLNAQEVIDNLKEEIKTLSQKPVRGHDLGGAYER